jgi:hypothetical protein
MLAGCGVATSSTLDERMRDLDAAVEVYETVDGAECNDPEDERDEEGAVVIWNETSNEDEFQRKLTSAMLADDHGIDGVVGVNVVIMNVDREAVVAQVGGDHP